MFLINDWSKDLPIVSIEERVVLLETSDPSLTELLLGQIKGKDRPQGTIAYRSYYPKKPRHRGYGYRRKTEMIVKLTR